MNNPGANSNNSFNAVAQNSNKKGTIVSRTTQNNSNSNNSNSNAANSNANCLQFLNGVPSLFLNIDPSLL